MATRRNDHSYVKRRDALKARSRKNNAPCHLCGKAIAYDADYRSPMAFTADHVTAVAAGGRRDIEGKHLADKTEGLISGERKCRNRALHFAAGVLNWFSGFCGY